MFSHFHVLKQNEAMSFRLFLSKWSFLNQKSIHHQTIYSLLE